MILRPLPDEFIATRDALHQIAFFALAPARYQATGRMGLGPAPGGFGSPRFDGKVGRVQGDTVVLETDDAIASQTISTVGDAARFFGIDYRVEWFDDFHDPLDPIDPDVELSVDDTAARALGHWFEFGFEVLGRLRSYDDESSEVQLWPEHFDPATELGPEAKRASYGASPGDAAHPNPYLYVAPWGEVDRDEFWNASGFNGASLDYSALLEAGDPVARGLDFLVKGHRAVTG